ncbi:MAG: alpha/beta hydrolase family protein [Wenzhouxiangella sp.]
MAPSFRTCLSTAFFSLGFVASLAHAAFPAEYFARVPDIQSVSMSADGNTLVALVAAPGSNREETALATWNLNDLQSGPVITPSGDRMRFIAASALKADRLLVFGRQEWTGRLGGCGEGRVTGATATFVTRLYLTDTEHSRFREAFADNTRRLGISEEMQRCLEIAGTASLVNTLPLDPENVIISQLNGLTLQSNFLLYNVRTGATELLLRAGGRTSPGLFDPRNGQLLTRTEIEVGATEAEQRILIRDPASGEFQVHDAFTRPLSQRFTVNITGRDEASGKFYVLTDLFSDRVEAWMYDPATRSFDAEPLVAHPEFSISSLILGTQPSNFNRILGFTVAGGSFETVWVDPDMAGIQQGLEQAFPGQGVSINAYNDDMSRVLFTTSSHRHAPAYHLLLDRQQVMSLGSQRAWIDPDLIGEQRWVTYTARDGKRIPAILDLPVGWSEGDDPLPAIVHPHGGPWVRDVMGWDATGWVPFLTSRGFAVLRPQYRGSSGLGRELWLAGDNEWGKAMQDDKDDGAKWMVEQGIADPNRMAIFGYSYGGFAAVAATVRENGPFQCAIAGAPVADLARIGNNWSENRLQRILQGRTVSGLDPMRVADQANIPILLYVGDRDVRTPAWHARNFHNAVRDRVNSELVIISDMPHSLPWYPRHHRETLGLIERFLANSCGFGQNGSG